MEFTNTTRILNEFGKFFVMKYQEHLDNADMNASYDLRNTLQYTLDVNGQSIDVYIYLQDYWKYIESGRKPGAKMPPISKIEHWIKIKPILPQPINGNLPTTKQLAFLIARSIKENGIPAKPIFQQSLEEVTDTFYDKIEEAVRKDIEQDFTDFLITTFRKTQR